MRRAVTTLTLVFSFAALASSIRAQGVAPAPGVQMPPEVQQSMAGKGMFEFKHAWIEKTLKIKENRDRYVDDRGFYKREFMPASSRSQFEVSGTFNIPIFCVKYSDTGADPFPTASLQTKLFDGPFAPRTMKQFYTEISYGDLTVNGTVYGWTLLPNTRAYYAGPTTCDGLCASAHIPDLINSTITANDGAINFGQYDNDGPDGIPNSGDDDGYVDFVSFVQPQSGAECGFAGHIWSHRFSLSGWGAAPHVTNDARTGGGNIIIDDYTIQPVINCDNVTLIDIGVFCHEFGHAFGLPDLYDTNGGAEGCGWWDLMSAGNWNLPTNPAHMGAWSKNFLGWSNVIVAPAVPTPYSVANVELNRQIYRLDVTHEKFRRTTDSKITGNYSLHCGLTSAEATGRAWANTTGSGYGNDWDVKASRDFNYNGSGSVSLQYQYTFALEPSYDYGYTEVTQGGVTTTVATYNTNTSPSNGTGSGSANINITPYLTAGPYTISFRVISDGAASDEDGATSGGGLFTGTTNGAMTVDNVSVSGGGESYFTDFETREDGWAEDMNPPSEYFLVENRKAIGSDVNIKGTAPSGGLVVWHVDTGDQNSNAGNTRPRGLEVVQADGARTLDTATGNRGDSGDPYPGSTNNNNLNGGTTPNSNGHDGPSNVTMAVTSANADPMNATLKGSWPAPAPVSITPTGSASTSVSLQVDGSLFAKTGSVQLVRGTQTFNSTSVYWAGKDRIVAQFNMTGGINGVYDVVVFNPGGASAVLTQAFTLTGGVTAAGATPHQNALLPAYPNPFNPETTIRYELAARSHVSLRVYDVSGAVVRTLVDESKAAGSYTLTWNGRDNHGSPVSSGVYFYRITAGSFSDVRKMTLLK
jgi:M6 family metalloprotease-like protein